MLTLMMVSRKLPYSPTSKIIFKYFQIEIQGPYNSLVFFLFLLTFVLIPQPTFGQQAQTSCLAPGNGYKRTGLLVNQVNYT